MLSRQCGHRTISLLWIMSLASVTTLTEQANKVSGADTYQKLAGSEP